MLSYPQKLNLKQTTPTNGALPVKWRSLFWTLLARFARTDTHGVGCTNPFPKRAYLSILQLGARSLHSSCQPQWYEHVRDAAVKRFCRFLPTSLLKAADGFQ